MSESIQNLPQLKVVIFPLGLNLLLSLDWSKDHAGKEGLDSLTPISVNGQILQSYSVVIGNIYFLCVRHCSKHGEEAIHSVSNSFVVKGVDCHISFLGLPLQNTIGGVA